MTPADVKPTVEPSEEMPDEGGRIDVGILTKGKPTLGMVLTSLLLQEEVSLRIHVVDTSARPVINRDDVRFGLRLASDRKVPCSYEYGGASDRAFSSGKARLIRALNGTYLCLMDDDVVVPSRALGRLLETARQHAVFGYVSPFCKNSPHLVGTLGARPQYSPGSLIYQDDTVHRILTAYYQTTVDVLDRRKGDQKVWETAFLTALFDVLDRPQIRQPDLVTYHLDYQEDPYWIEEEQTVIARSATIARALVQTLGAAEVRPGADLSSYVPLDGNRSPVHRGLGNWARRVLPWGH